MKPNETSISENSSENLHVDEYDQLSDLEKIQLSTLAFNNATSIADNLYRVNQIHQHTQAISNAISFANKLPQISQIPQYIQEFNNATSIANNLPNFNNIVASNDFLMYNPIWTILQKPNQIFYTMTAQNKLLDAYHFASTLFNSSLVNSLQNFVSSFNSKNPMYTPYIDANISNLAFTILDNPSLYTDFQTEIDPDINKITSTNHDFLVKELDRFILEEPSISEDILKTSDGKKFSIVFATLSGLSETFPTLSPDIQIVLQPFITSLSFLLIYYCVKLLNKV